MRNIFVDEDDDNSKIMTIISSSSHETSWCYVKINIGSSVDLHNLWCFCEWKMKSARGNVFKDFQNKLKHRRRDRKRMNWTTMQPRFADRFRFSMCSLQATVTNDKFFFFPFPFTNNKQVRETMKIAKSWCFAKLRELKKLRSLFCSLTCRTFFAAFRRLSTFCVVINVLNLIDIKGIWREGVDHQLRGDEGWTN